MPGAGEHRTTDPTNPKDLSRMIDPQDMDAAASVPDNDTVANDSPQAPSPQQPNASDPPQPPAPELPTAPDSPELMTPELDREVAAALSSMTTGDLAALQGGGGDEDSLSPGDEATGTVVGASGDDVFLQFGMKSQGVIPRSQFGKKESVERGRRVDIVVERFDAEAGLFIVSRKGSVQRAQWATLAVGSLVEGRVTGLIKGGLEIDLKGIRAFMPGSHTDAVPMKDISVLLNQMIRCEVIELDRRAKNVIVSRRKLVEKEQQEAAEKLKSELAVGQVRKGIVKNITDFGAFVDLGGIEGLIHVSQLSWGTVEKVSDVLKTGQEVEVQILKIDADRDRLSLGLKQTTEDPWASAGERYVVGNTLKARVVRVVNFGAFAELEPGIEGLIPVSEMSWKRVGSPSEVVSVGDIVDTVIIRMELEKRRIALSMKQAQPDPWDGILDDFSVDSTIKGVVTKLADFGAFVEVAPCVEGLIHISELADRRVRTVEEVVQVGQEVEARVLGVDKENRRISLSLKKQATALPSSAPDSPSPPRKKRAKPLRGGLSSHYEW